ncbi:hypothetical protein JNW98_34595, partial [Streptomyces sp. SCA2-4]|nr:hypothetical protein [Streptomyces huiliensis]
AARLAYRAYEERLAGDRWRTLARAGARPPRLLWHVGGAREAGADESGADENWADENWAGESGAGGTARVLRRVESLVAWGTGVALPAAALDAVAREGRLRGDALTDRHGPAHAVVARLERLGVSLDATAAALAARRLDRLTAAWAALRTSVAEQLRPADGRGRPGGRV